jgi:dihydroorotate dehydrogenase (fumarate)
MILRTTFDGLILENPLMPASGPLVGDAEKMLFLIKEGVGAMVTKTISSKDPKIPSPCIYGDRNYVMNSELWSEYAYNIWVHEFLPEMNRVASVPLIISVGYTAEDMELLIPLLDPFADAFEISTHYVGTDLSVIEKTVQTIRKHTSKPIYMKISPHLADVIGFARTVLDAGANGIVAINSLGPTMHINPYTRKIEYAPESGYVWMSGPVIKPLALATVYKIKQAIPECTVIGTGGIQSAKDVIEFLLAGADAVQMLSAALLKGKNLYSKIIDNLPKELEKLGFSSVEDVKQTKLINEVSYDKHHPTWLQENCTMCNLCEKVCPYFAITIDEEVHINNEKCFGCGLCISKCPVHALI